ncbi:MAG TPA: ABC transporter ATP-binding protein [Anaerohalosphaeraceae bacterium]|jgi:putative ABC transport system ATP-binding protein|nr:ABC transporter ATP-binding protein [Anaerohalosphaeraceae bacterium]HRT51418.1 ABC transporter ATP-binding protein [Anaerohalosphaeraceae bacterium]HRT87267.1 ABC transporter ATP-binding protein [Anaerohalosphaeraceae bacterium]
MIDYRDTLTFEKGRPVLVMRNLAKSYQLGTVELQVLRDINLTITSGEYVAIMGPSGSGKSTLLNLIGCLDRPTGGEYLLGGQNVSTLDDNQLSTIRGAYVGFVFQSFKLIAQLNIIENIEIPMYYQGYSEQESAARAMELAQMVGLGERTRHRPSELSGGQQQRVAIARALANDPLIILADEPTGNLDSASGTDILKILDRLHSQGKTLIVVTHDEHVAARAQRVIRLLDGRIVKEEINQR